MQGGDGLALFRRGRDAALLRQELSGLTAEIGVAVLRLLGLEHFGENADQVLFDGPVLLVQGIELLLGSGMGPPNAAAACRPVRHGSASGPGAAGRAAVCAAYPAE